MQPFIIGHNFFNFPFSISYDGYWLYMVNFLFLYPTKVIYMVNRNRGRKLARTYSVEVDRPS